MAKDLVLRVREFCAKRAWHGPDNLQEGFQLGEKRQRYMKEFVWPPATRAEIAAAEEQLGFKLPEPLRRLLGRLANGEFGPGYGFHGVPSAAHELRPRVTQLPETELKMFEMNRKHMEELKAKGLLPEDFQLSSPESSLERYNQPPPTIVADYQEAYSNIDGGPWLPLVDWAAVSPPSSTSPPAPSSGIMRARHSGERTTACGPGWRHGSEVRTCGNEESATTSSSSRGTSGPRRSDGVGSGVSS